VKHLYWIICGIIILALLVSWAVLVPAGEARTVKQNLDKSSLDLKDLEVRAKNQPTGVFDAENPADTERLAKDFLITERWLGVLQPHLDKYKNQLATLKTQLLSRKAWIRRPVSQTPNILEWYGDYVKASEALIARLSAANCLHLPVLAKSVLPEAVTPGETVTPTETTAGIESPSEIRTIAGLYTKVTAFPEPKEHPLLTARLHIMELIADRLIAARLAVAEHPLVGPTGRSEDRAQASAAILRTTWEGVAPTGEHLSHQVQSVVTPLLAVMSLDLRLELEGPLSALLAAAAAIERNADADRPLLVVTAATLSRRPDYLAGDRFDVAGEPVRLELALSVLEFLEPSEAAPMPDPAAAEMGMGGFMGGMQGMFPGPSEPPPAAAPPVRKPKPPKTEVN